MKNNIRARRKSSCMHQQKLTEKIYGKEQLWTIFYLYGTWLRQSTKGECKGQASVCEPREKRRLRFFCARSRLKTAPPFLKKCCTGSRRGHGFEPANLIQTPPPPPPKKNPGSILTFFYIFVPIFFILYAFIYLLVLLCIY